MVTQYLYRSDSVLDRWYYYRNSFIHGYIIFLQIVKGISTSHTYIISETQMATKKTVAMVSSRGIHSVVMVISFSCHFVKNIPHIFIYAFISE
jgi:hypothetical protein